MWRARLGLVAALVGCSPSSGGAGARANAGSASCGEVFTCGAACKDDACTARCIAAASPSARPLVEAVSQCMARAGCGDDQVCLGQRCDPEVRACAEASRPDAATRDATGNP